MKATGIVLATALASASAQAQLLDARPADPPARLEAEPGGRYGPLAGGFKRYAPLYGVNEAANPNDKVFQGFRTDPRLAIGYSFNQYLAVEGGYHHLRDEGFHKIDPYSPVESAVAAGALGAKSHTTYLAARITVPVGDRLTAYGKFGVSQSIVKDDGFVTRDMIEGKVPSKAERPFESQRQTGGFGAVGARYKLNDRATLSGEYRVNGSADKFGGASNASGLKGSVGIGF